MKVLYCGDTTLDTAASYLAGLITEWGWELTYLPSDRELSLMDNSPLSDLSLVIFSDYPASQVERRVQREIVSAIEDGLGLLMIGGWESWHGLGGDWDNTPVGSSLPVEISEVDDRVNCDRPVMVAALDETHAITKGLPWNDRPPAIGGFNRFQATAEGQVLLESVTHEATNCSGTFLFSEVRRDPLLVIGESGNGRTAALATDVAPHWVGPLVDWGDGRITAQASGGEPVEVGNLYAQFFQQLLEWTARQEC